MTGQIKYDFSTNMWKHHAPGGWYFVSVPKTISDEIRENLKWREEGWGRMKADASIGEIRWETAIWFDTKMDRYILPVKAEVRKKLKLETDTDIDVSIWV